MAKKKPVPAMPEFKPGDKPYCNFGKEILNKNVPWREVIQDILASGVTMPALIEEVGIEEHIIRNILLLNTTDGLTFRAGARIITIHYRQCSEYYAVE